MTNDKMTTTILEAVNKIRENNAVSAIIQKDKQIRTQLAETLREITAKYEIKSQELCERADVSASIFSSLKRDKRGMSVINFLKIMRSFDIAARLELVLAEAFPELRVSDKDKQFLIEYLEDIARESRKIQAIENKSRRERKP